MGMEKLSITEVEYRGLAQITRRLQFFRLLKGAQFERFLSRIELCRYQSGETVFHKGDLPMAFYLLYKGRVRIHLGYRLWGLLRKFAHLGPGDLFGEMAIVEKRLHSATAVAREPTQLFILSYEQFDELMKDDPDFAELIQFAVARRKFEDSR
jgi:CRP-like cAMP-binding protein